MSALLLSVFFQIAAPAAQAEALVYRAPVDTTAAVSVHARLWPDTVYVGQQALYQLVVFVDERSRDRVRRMEAIPPEMRAMMAYEAPQRSGILPTRVVGRRRYEPYIYQRPVFPLASGDLTLPPSRLVYAMPVSASFFSRVESMELWSDSTRIVVIEPPVAGRPADYRGAVGRVTVTASLDSSSARVGDPLTLTLRVTGRGNVKLFPRPEIHIPWASAVPAGERIEQGRDSLRIGGTKIFQWVLTPRQVGAQQLPPLRYPFFDPETGRYHVAETAPRRVAITPGGLARLDTAALVARPEWPLRMEYRGSLPQPPHRSVAYWVILAMAPLPALVLAARHRPLRRRRTRRAGGSAALLRLDQRGAPPAAIRRLFLQAAAQRLRVPAVTLGEPKAFERHARRAGVTERTSRTAAAFVEELNGAAFGPAHGRVERAHERALRLYERLDAEAVRRHWRTPSTLGLAFVMVVPLGAALALADDAGDAARFAEGISAYEAAEYATAVRAFEDVASRVPRAADAWANLGTAAYASADTARASWGWQRALRLEPLASDIRDRIVVLGDPGTAGASVPAIPVSLLALVAAALWLAGWGAAALRMRRRQTARPALLIALAAIGLSAAAHTLDRRIAGDDLIVLSRTEPLRFLPALGAERQGTALNGSIGRVLEERGGWVRIASGERTGWVERNVVFSLGRD